MAQQRCLVEESDNNLNASSNDNLVDVFPYTGANDFCQLFEDDKIACGGGAKGGEGVAEDGFGIFLESDMLRGFSGSCQTYDNPPLCGGEDGCFFEVANIEIWSLTPFFFVSDAEKSERALQLINENTADTPSTTSPWSNFL